MNARRLASTALALLCLLVGTLSVSAAPALAAPEAPVTLSPAKSITATTAILEGTLNPGAKAKAGWFFAYSTEITCALNPLVTPTEAEEEAQAKREKATVTELEPRKEYRFCMFATNEAAEATPSGNEVPFKTLPAKPSVIAGSEHTSGVSSTSATLEVVLNPNNQTTATTYSFEYATEAAGEVLKGTVVKLPGGGLPAEEFGERTVGAPTGAVLLAGTTYFYRAIAENAAHERSVGQVEQFATVPVPTTDPVTAVAATTATFNGHLTLDAVETQYYFDYKAGTECAGGESTPTVEAGTGAAPASEFTEVTGLQPDTVYTVCFVTANAFGIEQGSPTTFRTLPETYVTDVSSSAATLHAVLDPEGQPMTYHFQYGTNSSYGSETPEGDAGAGSSAMRVEFHQQALQPDTTYHFRVLATSAGGTVESADGTFMTPATGEALVLPDHRQWELVSPPDKEGGELKAVGGEGLLEAAANGDAITYESLLSPTEAEPAGFTFDSQVLSARGAGGGWSSRDINPPNAEATSNPTGQGTEYRLFSSDLSLGLVEQYGEGRPLLSPEASERTMYVRDDAPVVPEAAEQALYGEAQAQASAGSDAGYLPLVDPADVTAGANFGGRFPRGVATEGATQDLNHVVLKSDLPLTPRAVEAGLADGLYEWSSGRLQLVSVLPGVAEEPVSGNLGSESGVSAKNAVSGDGSRVVWTSSEMHLYMRDTAKGETLQLDTAEPGCGSCTSGGGEFQAASSDGSKVFFTDINKLTADARSALYMCEIIEEAGGRLTCNLTDLPAGEAVVGASEDGSYVYVVANAVVAEGTTAGSNLYVMHDSGGTWTTRFIAKLSGADANDWARNLGVSSARVSPDGRYLEFMSQQSLTGYDNLDANTGRPDQEVYLYHTETTESGVLEPGRLICASCSPSGARPVGIEAKGGELINQDQAWESGVGLAADVPGGDMLNLERGRYQSRYLSDGGRLFFNGVDPLVPQAANGVANVYEYEPLASAAEAPASDTCTTASSTYNPSSDGCVSLISGASSGEESVFLDASENGDDVFFLTSARLAPQDQDTAYDVYDAHVCSTAEPCPEATVQPPPCTNTDSCRAAPTPQPLIFGAPASATFSGTGNKTPTVAVQSKPKSKPVTCKKGLVKKKGKCVKRRKVKKIPKSSVKKSARKSTGFRGSK